MCLRPFRDRGVFHGSMWGDGSRVAGGSIGDAVFGVVLMEVFVQVRVLVLVIALNTPVLVLHCLSRYERTRPTVATVWPTSP